MELPSSKKWLWISLWAFFALLILGGLFWYFFWGGNAGSIPSGALPFGTPIQGTSQGGSRTTREAVDENKTLSEEPMFRQLTNVPIAPGAYALLRDGAAYVRYVEKGTGHVYEVDLENGAAKQLTNTTIPRVALADWTLDGNAVVLRYLEWDTLSGREVIKTRLGRLPTTYRAELSMTSSTQARGGFLATRANLNLPPASSSPSALPHLDTTNGGTSEGDIGTLSIEFLPDNVMALSVAPDGKNLFYLIKTLGGVAGSVVNLRTRTTKLIFQNSFGEWLPQLLNDGTIILSTKPSGGVAGYSYHYDPKTRALERLVREKDGLTTLGNNSGSRVLYGENIANNATLNVYNRSGFHGDEGTIFYEEVLPITTLPEKCVWFKDGVRVLCASFVNTPSGLIPDLWYQGRISFADTLWSVDTDTAEVAFLADPATETKREFDVISPIISADEKYLVFVNKKDGTLWSMRLPQKTAPNETIATPSADLSPSLLRGAQGSLPGSAASLLTSTTTTPKSKK